MFFTQLGLWVNLFAISKIDVKYLKVKENLRTPTCLPYYRPIPFEE